MADVHIEMSNFPLPTLNARNDLVTAVGFSSGSFESMELHLAYPELFKGVGLLGGGTPGSMYAEMDYKGFYPAL